MGDRISLGERCDVLGITWCRYLIGIRVTLRTSRGTPNGSRPHIDGSRGLDGDEEHRGGLIIRPIKRMKRDAYTPGVLLKVQLGGNFHANGVVPLGREREEFEVICHLKEGELVIGMGISHARKVPYVRVLTRDGVCGILYPTLVKVV